MRSTEPPTPYDARLVEHLAGEARTMLACPSSVRIVVDGVPDVLEGSADVGMHEVDGRPVLGCRPDTPLARAGASGRPALLTLTSALSGPEDRLTLGGRLEVAGQEGCVCCGEVRDQVALVLDLVALVRPAQGAMRRVLVPVEQFTSAAHRLNRGFLRSAATHAEDCHQDELRAAVSAATGTPRSAVLGVSLVDLSTAGVTLGWVDPTGAHRRHLTFPHPARDGAELGQHVRALLHRGLG